MKKILIAVLGLVLVSCGSNPPAPSTSENLPTPIVIVETVLVTQAAPATPIPGDGADSTPASIPTAALPTQDAGPGATATPGNTTAVVPVSGWITIPASFNGSDFSNLSVSGNSFSLRCNPKEISFDVNTTDVYITQVDLYWRLRDKHSEFIPNWSWGRTLETDGLYHFWITITGADVPPDLRKQQAWFDFEFVGINKSGQAIGRTEKITGLVSYTIDC